MASRESAANSPNSLQVEKALNEAEKSLNDLETRYRQVKKDWLRKKELLAEKELLKAQKRSDAEREPIKTQINLIQKELDQLELNLESTLLPDIFWQVVRFVGVGILIGWGLSLVANRV